MFVVDNLFNLTIEVFDSYSKNFALLQIPSIYLRSDYIADVTSIGNKVFIFSNRDGSVFLYDVEIDALYETSSEATKQIENFSCASLPQ